MLIKQFDQGRLIRTLLGALGIMIMATGCSVESSQIKLANIYQWTQTEHDSSSGLASSSSRSSTSLAHIMDNFPVSVEQTKSSYFPLTAAHLSLGSYAESEKPETDYV